MKKILTLLIALVIGQSIFAQSISLEQYENAAQEAYEAKNWSKALAYYNILLEIDSTRNDARFFGGQSAYALRSHEVAKNLLSGIPVSDRINEYALTDFVLGNNAKGREAYVEAMVHYQTFVDQNSPNHTEEIKRAERELDYVEWALEKKSNPANVEIIHLDQNVNTIYSDISPFVKGEELYYARIWETEDKELKGKDLIKLYRSIDDMSAVPVSMRPEERNMHIANLQSNDTDTRAVYTVCDTENLNCKIYQMTKGGDGSYSRPKLLSDKINMPGYQNTHPALGRNAENDTELLFFSSNRPGGEGGMDIWCSVIQENGNISVPVNIPAVNSPDDEITPSFQNEQQTLYFSSTGYKGMGGFDIYSSQKEGNNWSEPVNSGYPINGGYDETYYSFNNLTGAAHFVSNRPGAFCANEEKDCVCNDIYRIPITVSLEAFTFNTVDNSNLAGVRVELENLTTGVIDTFIVNENGHDFSFPLLLGQNYRLTATKDGYSAATTEFTTKGITENKVLREELTLAPTIVLEVYTYDAINSLPLNATTVTLTDIISEKSNPTVNTEGSYQCEYTLEFGREYKVSASKLGYSDSEVLTFSTIGINTPTKIVKELYLQPFTGLPITVYFDNDYPNPRTLAVTCDKTYDATFDRYITRKEVFQSNYSAGLTGVEQSEAKNAIGGFFDDEVQVGYDKLLKFSNTLIDYFESGTVDTIEIELQGYASPLAKNDYNKNLTARRVDAVQNHFEVFSGGVFLKFIQNGRLRFVETPNGEELAKPNVSPDYNNRRKSVFSPEASRERRVRIIDVRRKDGFLSYVE